MADLKPIGSEKLKGQAKLKRIMEIARFNETLPNNINETSRSEFGVQLADGNSYEIIKERQGYIIKKVVSEGTTDYIEPMKNRKYFSSYSQAFKRLNLLAAELNRINENEEGVALFGEQKKFVLKTPKPVEPEVPAAAPPSEPPPVPSPELPASPDAEALPMGDEMGGMGDEGAPMGDEMPVGDDMAPEAGTDLEGPSDEKVTFKTIQKLTGKLTQKIRTLESEEGMTSENIKYVINMVLSSLELDNLSDEDKEDILSKFEEVEGEDEMGGEEMPSPEEDITSDTEVEDIQTGMDIPTEGEVGEASHGAIFDHIFKESKVDKVISKYFEVTKKEILENREKNNEKQKQNIVSLSKQMVEIKKLVETKKQEIAAKKFLVENVKATFVGKTNKKNLVFEKAGKQIKISPEGMVL